MNPSAPLVTDAIIAEFLRRADLRENLRESYQRMFLFYRAPGLRWLAPNNHNHLRITRILKCLRLLGLPDCAEEFLGYLRRVNTEYPGRITAESFAYWTQTPQQ